ncbi:PRA1 family protein B4 [Hibiscus syriacus]|uniref:PRA1 family protein n=1 Tax=Hibiscus syriacus TaxID=106335 RepID=A0A6A2Z378_HIBSY|nr:PRA1 family protein B4-like [Hibiscus syriacus]KAE8685545.1 PRA1 family protein B4 [Hibiscus syriacus]
MSTTGPAVLPISSAQSVESQPPAATPAVLSFLSHLNDSVRNGLSQRRPWAELADRSAFSKPESFSDALVRVRKNYSYFRVNYLSVIGLILAFSLLSHPFSLLLLLGLLSSWIFLFLFRPADKPLVVFGRSFSDRETLGILIVFSVFVVFLTSVGSLLISALMVGVGLVCAHGAFRAPEDLFLDEQEQVSTGFLSYLGGAASNAAASAAPVVAARV